eukprot:s9091_g1.t1
MQGRGKGWCSNRQCREAEKEENLRRKSEEKSARQEQRAAQGASSRGPMPGRGRGGRPEEEGSTRAQRRELQAERADEGAGGRGPTPGRGGRPEEEGSSRVQRRELQAERADAGVGGRGPRPIATEAEQRGYPFADEDVLNPEQVQARYLAFTRSWGRFGLSRLCEACYTLTPAKHCRKSTGAEKMLCRNCREKNTKFLLPVLPAIPEALRQLQPIEQHLIAMARISQVLLDKLPAGGPSAQWGRMYAVLVDEPYICDVLEGATLEEEGTVLVEGVQGQIASPARLDRLFKALQELKAQHRLYKANPAVGVALADMEAILARTGTRPSSSAIACADHVSSQGRQTGESGGSHSSALGCSEQTPGKTEEPQAAGKKQEGVLEITYLMPKELKAPRPQKADLQKARSIAELSDDMDVKVFPHLFPTGTGGWQNGYGSLSQYARKRLLGLDPRFQASPAYIMWLLEMHIKKRLSGNINVRISGQTPNAKSKYQEGRGHVFTALRDIPGTSSYVFAKKGVALNMYEQLGTPKFFMTLSCHARQPDILIAVIMARLLQLHPEKPPQELEREAAQILQCYQADRKFTWDGLSPNQLCNQYPAVVTRQFMHQLTQLMHWLSAGQGAASRMEEDADAQDEPEDALEQDFLQAPAADSAGRHRGVRKEDPPFRVVDYVIRIEWQKRGYPHAHILLWVVEWENKEKPDDKTKSTAEDKDVEAEAQVPAWSDDEAMKHFTPTRAEDWSDKYITTKGPFSWRQSTKVSARDKELNAQLAELLVHKHTEYCGIKTHGACRFGFPHQPEPRTRRRSSQEKYANSRWKSSLATRRAECDKGMGQYNIKILRRWRASMDLQVICELTSASRYILGYALKSEQDQEAQRRVESIVASLTSSTAADTSLSNQQIYKAAHAALQGRTTSTFEACHLLLGFPVVQFSRDNEWIQVGPPETWTLSVPKYEESAALQRPHSYRHSKMDRDGYMPVAKRWYREVQRAFSEQEVDVPVEGGKLTTCRFRDLHFLDFCAGFKFIGVDFPRARKRPAIVAYRNFSPDQEPEAFYYSRLMLYTVWKEPGDWLREEDGGSHAAAFRRLAMDVDGNPNFLRSRCFPQMDGTVNAARKLQAVQATMYMRARMHPGDGWANSKVAQDNYEDSLKIIEALRQRHGDDIDFMAPEHVPTGAAGDAFAPVEDGEESFDLLTVENPDAETQHQRRAVEYIIHSTLKPTSKGAPEPERLHMLLHGPGGCGKSVVVRASAHMLRQSGIGVIIAAPTGVAAWNINGVTLHSCCLLPVVNKSYGKACDLPLPCGPQLAALQNIWNLVSVLFVDEMSFVSSYMLERLDQHLRLAKNAAYIPFGGVHLVLSGDLYQLPPPGGLPPFASRLWMLFQLCELEGNHRASKDPKWAALLARVRVGKHTDQDVQELHSMVLKPKSGKQPAAKAVYLYATRRAVAESNCSYIEEHVKKTGGHLYECPSLDTNVKTGAPLSAKVVWADPENTGGLEALLRIAIGVRVMLRHNIDVQDGLVNGACGFVEQIDADEETNEVDNIWIAFEKNAGAKWCAENDTNCVAISRRSASFLDMEGSKASRLQFPLVIAKAISIHKSQAATLHDGAHSCLDATCNQNGQAYVALSRCPRQAVCTLERFNPKVLRFNADAEWALTKLKTQQADREGSQLWKQLFQPPESKKFYESKLRNMRSPDWVRLQEERQEGWDEPPWQCPDCGQEMPDTKAAKKQHRRTCPAKPAPVTKAKPKATGAAKAKGKSQANAKSKAKADVKVNGANTTHRPLLAATIASKRPATDNSLPTAPAAKVARMDGRTEAAGREPHFFERQEALRCGLHALNNALGSHYIDMVDMPRAAEAFMFENVELGDHMQDHLEPQGEYSIEIMSMVLRTKAMEAFGQLRWHMDIQRAMTAEDLHGCIGAVVNLEGRHWVALRPLTQRFLYLDSVEERPRELSKGELDALLVAHPAYALRHV